MGAVAVEDGTVEVLTFKEGVLSPLAHDLLVTVERFSIQLDDDHVAATFDAASLRVVGALRDGRLQPGELDASQRREIEGNIRRHVLDSEKHPHIDFTGTVTDHGSRREVAGELRLAGRVAPVRLDVHVTDGAARGEVTLTPSVWGIRPFRAMLGALRVADRVVIRFDLRVPQTPQPSGGA